MYRDREKRDPLWFDEAIIRLKNAIVQQAVIDWTFYTKKVEKFEAKYPYCTKCNVQAWDSRTEDEAECFFTAPKKYGRHSLMMEYRLSLDTVREVEEFLESDYCEFICGVEKGYILNRLKKEPFKVRQKGKNT